MYTLQSEASSITRVKSGRTVLHVLKCIMVKIGGK